MRFRKHARLVAAVAATTAIAVMPAGAQEASGKGFLFGAPHATVSVRVGYAGANAGSDIFSFVTSQLTVNHRDFGSFDFGGDLAIPVTPHIAMVLSVDNSGRSTQSEYREWMDNNNNPIEQVTSFSRLSYTASARYYLMTPGRSLGRLAWIPRRFAPWVSAGIGRTFYSFGQSGDFIDFNNGNSVFTDAFRSSEWTTTGELAAGLDWSLSHRFALTTQARYLLGNGDLQDDYSGFAPIDLSGVGMTAGVTVRF